MQEYLRTIKYISTSKTNLGSLGQSETPTTRSRSGSFGLNYPALTVITSCNHWNEENYIDTVTGGTAS